MNEENKQEHEMKTEQNDEKKNCTQDHQEQKHDKVESPVNVKTDSKPDPVPANAPLVVINHKHSYTGLAIVVAALVVAAYLHFVAGVF